MHVCEWMDDALQKQVCNFFVWVGIKWLVCAILMLMYWISSPNESKKVIYGTGFGCIMMVKLMVKWVKMTAMQLLLLLLTFMHKDQVILIPVVYSLCLPTLLYYLLCYTINSFHVLKSSLFTLLPVVVVVIIVKAISAFFFHRCCCSCRRRQS